jgi:hypothetical protein
MAMGLARGIADHVTQQADPMAFLTANEEAIRVGLAPLGKQHFANLKTAVEAMTINRRTIPPTGSIPFDSGDPVFNKFGATGASFYSQYRSVIQGRSSEQQEAVAFLGRWFNKLRRDHKSVAMEAVFYDKDAAQALANLARNPASEKAKIDFATQMMSLGVRAEVAGQE